MAQSADWTDRVDMTPSHHPLAAGRRLARETPVTRNRYVDLLRALSILVVVFGHWLMAAPEYVGDDLRVGHLIAEVRWGQALTWVLQVMPIFFFVGGYSNAVGWRSTRRDATPYGAWLRARLRRLVLPVVPVLAVWAPGAYLALQAGVDPDLVRIGSQAALVPVWFLATYVLIVMMAPVTLALWERYGWGGFWALVGTAAVVDAANLAMGMPVVQWLNYLFVWNAVHMLGYAWADGRVSSVRRRLAMAAGGLATLAVLVAVFVYPMAMVGLDGATVTNSNPPKITLIALGVFQFGVALAMEAPARRWLEGERQWAGVITVNGWIMSIYLWHLTAMVAVLGGSIALGGIGLHVRANSVAWWLTRPLFLAVMAFATLPLLGLFGRFERPRRDPRPAPRAWRPILAAVATCAGLGLLARFGVADADGLNGLALALPAVGVLAGGVVGAGRWSRRATDQPTGSSQWW